MFRKLIKQEYEKKRESLENAKNNLEELSPWIFDDAALFFFALTRNITDADVRCIFILRYIGIPIIHNKIAQDFHTNLYFMLLLIKIVRIFFYDNM